MDCGLKLRQIYVEAIYNDYSTKLFIFEEDLDIDKIKEKVSEEIKKYENLDSEYVLNLYAIYEITNKELIKFSVEEDFNFRYREEVKIDFPFLVGEKENWTVETPEQKKPLKYKLEREIRETQLISCNGIVLYNNIDRVIEKLNKLKQIK